MFELVVERGHVFLRGRNSLALVDTGSPVSFGEGGRVPVVRFVASRQARPAPDRGPVAARGNGLQSPRRHGSAGAAGGPVRLAAGGESLAPSPAG